MCLYTWYAGCTKYSMDTRYAEYTQSLDYLKINMFIGTFLKLKRIKLSRITITTEYGQCG